MDCHIKKTYIIHLHKEGMAKVDFSMPVIFVKDINISKNFYQDIMALEIEMDFGKNIILKNAFSIWEEKCAREIIFGNKKIHENKNHDENNIELYFETNDIESIWESVKLSKTEVIHPIKEESWGQRVFRFYDPDRYIIEVAEPMSNVVKRYHELGFSKENISKKTQMPLSVVKKILE